MSLKIKHLSDKVIAQISAGEVIERPLSVIKELVENSIDANATQIDIKLSRGGRNLIMITDNGIGIGRDDLNMALKRHATSKLVNEDITQILHMGFRGEALASIASVAKVKIKSKLNSLLNKVLDNAITIQNNINSASIISKDIKIAESIISENTNIDYKNFTQSFKDSEIHSKNFEINAQNREYENSAINFEKNSENLSGWMIDSDSDENSDNLLTKPVICHEGTAIEVRDLFCYMPHRLRFLRKESSENSASIDLIERLAIAHPHIGFSMSIDDKNILHYNPCLNLAERISQVFGSELLNKMIKIDQKTTIIENQKDTLEVYGYITIPTVSRKKQLDSYCYVNGRMVKDVFFYGVIKAAYSDVLPSGLHPTVILFVNLPHALTDVNIHPNKIQVRFVDEHMVRRTIMQSLRTGIKNSGTTSIIVENLSNQQNRQYQEISNKSSEYDNDTYKSFKLTFPYENLNSQIDNKIACNELTKQLSKQLRFDQEFGNEWNLKNHFSSKNHLNNYNTKKVEDNNLLLDHSTSFDSRIISAKYDKINLNQTNSKLLGYAICQIGLRYILAQSDDGVIIVDQHAAHERLTLEKLKKYLQPNSLHIDNIENDLKSSINEMISSRGLPKQTLLIPKIIELSYSLIEKLKDAKEELNKLGFDISFTEETFSEQIKNKQLNTITIHSVPELLNDIDLVDLFSSFYEENSIQSIISKEYHTILGKIACYSSIRSGKKLSIEEMNWILRQIEIQNFTEQCNHGRPTYLRITQNELDKLFER